MDDEEVGLAPRVAMVTGGTTGLGKASALELVRRGWSVFLQHTATDTIDKSVGMLQTVADEISAGGEVAAGQADLTVADDREMLIEQLLEVYGRIDLLVNAGVSTGGGGEDLLELSEDTYRDAIDTGVTAALFLTQLVANEMVRLVEAGNIENPRIVTINSIGAYASSVDHAAQCISRAGVSMITRLFADRLAVHGITVYEIRAGIISAGAGDEAHARYEGQIREGLTPIRRWGRPQDVARAVAAVAEGLLGFSTGEVINVDGGFHLRRL